MDPAIIIFFCLATLICIGAVTGYNRNRRAILARRKSLHYDAAIGRYVWIGLNGQVETALRDPSAKGGAWHAYNLAGSAHYARLNPRLESGFDRRSSD